MKKMTALALLIALVVVGTAPACPASNAVALATLASQCAAPAPALSFAPMVSQYYASQTVLAAPATPQFVLFRQQRFAAPRAFVPRRALAPRAGVSVNVGVGALPASPPVVFQQQSPSTTVVEPAGLFGRKSRVIQIK